MDNHEPRLTTQELPVQLLCESLLSRRVARYEIRYHYSKPCNRGLQLFYTGGRKSGRLVWRLDWYNLGASYVELLSDVKSPIEAKISYMLNGSEKARGDSESYIYFKQNTRYNLQSPSISLNSIFMTLLIVLDERETQEAGHSRHWLELFESGKYADLTIIVGGQHFPAHSLILSAVSPVFEAMIHSDMAEKRDKEIKIIDTPPEIMELVLRYLYTGKISGLETNASEILKVAEKYLLQELKEFCVKELIDSIKEDNAIELYCISQVYSLAQLKTKTSMFLGENREVFRGEQWAELKAADPNLALQLVEDALL